MLELIVVIADGVHDMLRGLNPLSLLNKEKRAAFRAGWQAESTVSKIGFVVGTLLFFLLVGTLLFAAWLGWSQIAN